MSRLGLNIDLDDVARRLSFSPDPDHRPPQMPPRQVGRFRVEPALSPIAEEQEQEAAATHTPARPPPWVSSPSQAPPSAPHTGTYEWPAMSLPPVSPSPSPFRAQVPAPPTPQQVAAALGKLEQARQAGLQQAWVAAQQQQALAGWEQRRQDGLQQPWALAQPQPQQAASTGLGQGRTSGPQQAWAEAQQQQQLRLYTVEGEPAGYKTKWEDLHPFSQHLLLQIEDRIREERQACEQLEQCSRLCDPSVSNSSFELDARHITQEIGSISTIMNREKASIQRLMDSVKESMSIAEFAIGSYVNLRPWFVSRGAANTSFANHAGSSAARTHGSVRRPSIFMQRIVDRFEKQLEECCKLIGELEQLVQMKNTKTYPASLESLPKVMSNMHDYFIFVASKVENLHQYADAIRIQYLNDLRNSGNRNDPFVEADRKEAAKQEAASITVHPTLAAHLSPHRMVTPQSRRQMCN
ncbi:nuclear pore complex protein NUP58-like [Lolium rigidum]|uniref:nuclear pore complex protein NUP58-like n=1 Tax=Lolium rigidum TaxID=89674 RepID=UPI001F5D6FFB|nr:nuclear pore complex protein NUP58-like [Lolium rigidum]